MSELETIRRFYRYNARVRQNYLARLLAVSPAERLRDRGASFPSIQEIFVHVLDGLRWWFQYVPEDGAEEAELLPARDLGPDALAAAVAETDRIVFAYLDRLRPGDLEREMVCHFPSETGPTETRFVIGDVLWHMVEEELQHRGELNALLWQIDVEPPNATQDDWDAVRGSGRPADPVPPGEDPPR